jgi:alkanesulfonate monooxygenase SsuD/methylene tetrahydromethanopterin reductase-like flavin-dependent oxidoreductase (luciferase family)
LKLGIALGNFGLYGKSGGAPELIEIAEQAERLGYDSVWLHDHLLMPAAIYYGDCDLYPFLATLCDRSLGDTQGGFQAKSLDVVGHFFFCLYRQRQQCRDDYAQHGFHCCAPLVINTAICQVFPT